jgi:hypothetical protein
MPVARNVRLPIGAKTAAAGDATEHKATLFAPGEEPAAGADIGAACVGIVDVGSEEFDVAPAAGGRRCRLSFSDEDRHYLGAAAPRRPNETRRAADGHPRWPHDATWRNIGEPVRSLVLAGEPLSIGAGRAAPVTGRALWARHRSSVMGPSKRNRPAARSATMRKKASRGPRPWWAAA